MKTVTFVWGTVLQTGKRSRHCG